jgi:hypothetical protein
MNLMWDCCLVGREVMGMLDILPFQEVGLLFFLRIHKFLLKMRESHSVVPLGVYG